MFSDPASHWLTTSRHFRPTSDSPSGPLVRPTSILAHQEAESNDVISVPQLGLPRFGVGLPPTFNVVTLSSSTFHRQSCMCDITEGQWMSGREQVVLLLS